MAGFDATAEGLFRIFIEEGDTDFEGLIDELEELLGPDIVDQLGDFLPPLFAAEKKAYNQEQAEAQSREATLEPTYTAAAQIVTATKTKTK